MYIDAKSALGDEQMRMEHEANMLKAQTINGLNVQEKELLLNEAMRIEEFNNSRDASEAQALVNLGMAKLQSTIEEVQRSEDKQERAQNLRLTTMLQTQATREDTRRWDAEFALKKSSAASGAAGSANQAQFLANNSGWSAADVSAMSDSMRKSLFDQISKAKEASQVDMAAHQDPYFDLINSGWTAGQASTAIQYHIVQLKRDALQARYKEKGLSVEIHAKAYEEYRKKVEVIKMLEAPYLRKDSSGDDYLSTEWTAIEQAVQRLRLTGAEQWDVKGDPTGPSGRGQYSSSPGYQNPGSLMATSSQDMWNAINAIENEG